MKVLGIESSCDETAVSIVNANREILSHVVVSQIKEHQLYGGVVPEIASRAHLIYLERVFIKALEEASCSLSDIDAIAVTSGPGLIGGLLVGTMFAKGVSFSANKPLIGVNHLEAHALTARLTNSEVEFPYLLLLVSGGHCQILVVKNIGEYQKLGGTLDDAVGEAFDKVAKMLKLGYPGGPIIENLAKDGNEFAYDLPLAMKGRAGCDFSFSGLKTAVRLIIEKENFLEEKMADICATFQRTVADILIDRLNNAVKLIKDYPIKHLVIAGGVAANRYLYARIKKEIEKHGIITIAPPISLCTDNGAMVAWAGIEKLKLGLIDDLNLVPKARWPL